MKFLIHIGHCRYLFYALFLLLIFFLFLNYALLVSIPPLVFVAILVFTAFIGDKDELFSVCICCISWCEAIEWHYVLIFCIVIFVLKYGKEVKIDFGVIPIIMIVIWEFLHCLSGEVNLKMMVSYSSLYLFLILLFFARDMQTIDYGFIMRNFAFAVFGVCCVLLVCLFIHNNFNFDLVFLDMRRLGMTEEKIGGLVINPNSLGILCILAVGGLMQTRFAGQKKVLDIFLIVLLLFLGALTGSRTFLACLLVLGVFLLVVSNGGMKNKIKFLIGGILILTISIVLLYEVFPTALEMFILRLNAQDITGGRASLFVVYNDYLFSSIKSIFWGVGALDLGSKVNRLSIANNVPHNGVQEILVAWGILGLLLFIAMVLVLIRRSKQENPHQLWMNYSLFFVLLAKIMVGQVITSSYTMLAFALIYLSLCRDCTSKNGYK